MTRTALGIVSLTTACLAGCASQIEVQPTGFLKDYSILKERSGRAAPALFYVNPTTDFNTYDKIMLEPVTVWVTEGSDLSDVPREDLDILGSLLYKSIKDEVEKRGTRQFVTQPGPGVIRVRLAITEASEASVMNVVMTVIPNLNIITEGISMATGTRSFVGTAGLEGEATDSMTGELLVAGVDRRQGGRDLSAGWGQVEDAIKVWASEIALDMIEIPRR